MWKEAIVVYFNALYQYMLVVTEDNQEDLSQDCGFLGRNLDSGTSRIRNIRSRGANHYIGIFGWNYNAPSWFYYFNF
jgi:hypothetical protein